MSFLLEKGQRGLLVGQTGSGKTENAIFQLKHPPVWPVFVLDTKIEDKFFSLQTDDDDMELIESIPEFEALSRRQKKTLPDYVLVRPSIEEVTDISALDTYSQMLYNKFGPCFIYYDEIYNWHNRGVPGNGLVGLLTRGRSKGKTVLQASQRPGWISRFCFTESQKFYVHNLIDHRDRKTLDSMIPSFSGYPQAPKFHFYHFEVGEHDSPQLYLPVPYEPLDKTKIFTRKWV